MLALFAERKICCLCINFISSLLFLLFFGKHSLLKSIDTDRYGPGETRLFECFFFSRRLKSLFWCCVSVFSVCLHLSAEWKRGSEIRCLGIVTLRETWLGKSLVSGSFGLQTKSYKLWNLLWVGTLTRLHRARDVKLSILERKRGRPKPFSVLIPSPPALASVVNDSSASPVDVYHSWFTLSWGTINRQTLEKCSSKWQNKSYSKQNFPSDLDCSLPTMEENN